MKGDFLAAKEERDCTTAEVVGCIGLLCAFCLGVIVGLLF